MNILPVVSTLLITSLLTYTSFTWKNQMRETVFSAHRSYLEANRDAMAACETMVYESFKKQDPKKKKADPRKGVGEPRKHLFHRAHLDINLHPLFMNGKPDHEMPLYRLSVSFLYRLYGTTFFSKKGSAETFFNALLKRLADLKEKNIRLEKLSMGNQDQQLLYYHLLKRSASYPSLLDFFTVDTSKTDSTICITHASKEILEELFGPEAARSIIAAREMGDEIELDRLTAVNKFSIEKLIKCNRKEKIDVALGEDEQKKVTVRRRVELN